MAERVQIQTVAHPKRVYEARDEGAGQELVAAEEWVFLSERWLAFAHMVCLGARQTPREGISDMIRRITRDRACLWWEAPPLDADAQKYDRVVEVGWQNRRYGFLGFAPGYLASIMTPNLPSLFASLCGQLISLIERQLLSEYQITRLEPLAVREKLTPREHDLLCSLAIGEIEDEAACRLGVSPKTIITHRHRLYQKLGVHDAHQAVMRGFTLGYLNAFDLPE